MEDALEAFQRANQETVVQQAEWLRTKHEEELAQYQREVFAYSLALALNKAVRPPVPTPPKRAKPEPEDRPSTRLITKVTRPKADDHLPVINLVGAIEEDDDDLFDSHLPRPVVTLTYEQLRSAEAFMALRWKKVPWINRRGRCDRVYHGIGKIFPNRKLG